MVINPNKKRDIPLENKKKIIEILNFPQIISVYVNANRQFIAFGILEYHNLEFLLELL